MKNLIFAFFIICSVCAFSQKSTVDVSSVINSMKIQENAWNNGNIKEFMNYYWKSDSLKFIGSKGIKYGWQQTLDNYLKSYPNKEAMGFLKFTIEESTQLSATSIYIIGKWELQKDKPVGGYFTLLWKKINGSWVIVSDHTS
jgi:hypothetical protein